MSSERFQTQDRGSFFGDMIYDRVVPADHFLRKLEELVPWDRFTRKLVKRYRGKARQGLPPYDPAVLLKMLLVAYLYNLSERQMEVVASDSLSIKWFLGFGGRRSSAGPFHPDGLQAAPDRQRAGGDLRGDVGRHGAFGAGEGSSVRIDPGDGQRAHGGQRECGQGSAVAPTPRRRPA
jgi:hypothetical protein